MIGSLFLLIFPFTYILSGIYALRGVIKNEYPALLTFFVFGLPIYITALSILHLYGWDFLIPYFQYSKEVLIFFALLLLFYRIKEMPTWNWLDKLMLVYFIYTGIFILVPIGGFDMVQRIVAFKNISLFPLLYLLGRLITIDSFQISRFQKQVMLLAVAASILLVGEVLLDTHLQSIIGYASFNEKYFSFDPAGNFGLSWTFEIAGGVKRFASFFANPLEHGASTLITLAVLASIFANPSKNTEHGFFFVTLIGAGLSILFALSRASLVGFVLSSYLLFRVLQQKKILIYYRLVFFLLVIIVGVVSIDSTIADFAFDTLQFNDSSSLSHLLEWVNGMEAMVSNPFGMGLGESGRVAGEWGLNTGGENQFIILGVQCGFPAMILYILIIGVVIFQAAHLIRHRVGLPAIIGTLVFVIKVGLIIPLLTSAAESYLYVSYTGWFLTGLLSTLYSSIHDSQPALVERLNTK